MGMSTDETIRLILETGGIETVRSAIEALRELKEQTGELSTEQEKALVGLEYAKTLHEGAGTWLDSYTKMVNEEALEQRNLRAALDETIEANKRLQAEEERLAEIVERNAVALKEAAGAGSDVAGFSGLAANMMKAEKVGMAIGTGHGLARMGPMLESITASLGLGGGVGMAAGGLLFAFEGIIPKIKEFVEAWEMGVKPIDDASAAIERLNRAQGESRQKRALGKIDSQITALEDKEDEQGFLDPGDQQKLRKLRERSKAKHDEFDMEAQEEAERKRMAKIRDELDEERGVEDDPDARYAARHHAAIDAYNKGVDERNATKKQANQDFAAGVAGINETMGIVAESEKAKKHQAAQAKAAQVQADREARKQAHDNTPMAELRREQQAQHEAVAGYAVGQWNQSGRAESPAFVQSVIRDATARLPDTGGNIAEAVAMAVQAGYAKAQQDQERAMRRMVQTSQSRLD
jgi:hypothetical protein